MFIPTLLFYQIENVTIYIIHTSFANIKGKMLFMRMAYFKGITDFVHQLFL
ncbi:hypothetical protein B4145_2935 [Bacillus subtilis]|uniref:Uncharacterized protein n=1 Tax=Bacillus subtilis subsp. subtilis TaxID=135461 RepID=A0ABD3ZXE8_BACIU|nr:hypothetical protein B4067_2969 [Bacillus subtilis subsp. subtilis]KIN37075.1 hypothetical protein B4070_2649 [Bacillus subtilis]KIN57916.1 hypothetical protein B4145_2935 [Bacillus subtilis]